MAGGESGIAKKIPKEYKPGQHVIVKLSNGRIEEARVNHVIQQLWQVVEE